MSTLRTDNLATTDGQHTILVEKVIEDLYVPDGTGAFKLPAGTDSQRPTTGVYAIRFNTDTGYYEGWNGNTWASLSENKASGISYDNASSGLASLNVQAAIDELISNSTWYAKAVGEPFLLRDDLAGVEVPPTDNSNFRFIRLTSGQDGAGEYNEGVLINETIVATDAGPVITAEINLSGSPIDGTVVNLVNSEGRYFKPGESSGSVADDQFQGFSMDTGALEGLHYRQLAGSDSDNRYVVQLRDNSGSTAPVKFYLNRFINNGINGAPRTGDNTDVRHQQATSYMRIL